MRRNVFLILAALALLTVASDATAGRGSGRMDYFHSFQLTATDSLPTLHYFAKAGSVTANADSSIGYVTHFMVENTGGTQMVLRVYGPHGKLGTGGPSGTYSIVKLRKASANYTTDMFVAPPGMRVFGILQPASVDANVIRYDYGK